MSHGKLSRFSQIIIYLILILGAVMMVLPFIWMLSTAIKPTSETFLFPPTFIPIHPQFRNFIDAWNAVPFDRFYVNSIIVMLAVTIGQLITSSLGAYAFARINFWGRDKIFLLYLATMMIPFQVTMIPIFAIVSKLHWINTYWALIIPSLFSPYGTFLLRQFFMGIPNELEESVRIDGGSYLTCYAKIILPLSKPALAALGTFIFLWCWNNFLWPLLVVNTVDMFTLPLGISLFQSQNTIQWNMMMAASTIALLPLLVVFLFAQKYFVEGITLSGLKG